MITVDGNALVISPETDPRVQRDCPLLWRAIHAKRYLVPNYRQGDYENQEELNDDFEFGLMMSCIGLMGYNDDVQHAMYANYCGGLWYDRPLIFLEKELATPLNGSPLPTEMVVEDIEWRWPQFRVMLPKGLITIERDGQARNMWFLDLCFIDEKGMRMPPAYAEEVERFIYKNLTPFYFKKDRVPATGLYVKMAEPYMAIVGGIDWNESGIRGTNYASIMPWNNKRIGELLEIRGGLQTAFPCDDADNVLLDQMLRLALNILLFLSQKPVLYKPEVVRPERQEGKRTKPALLKAHFVGQERFKAVSDQIAKKVASEPTGKHLRAMWRKGHWKRQPYGPKHALRRWQWISIYHTFGTGLDELEKQQ